MNRESKSCQACYLASIQTLTVEDDQVKREASDAKSLLKTKYDQALQKLAKLEFDYAQAKLLENTVETFTIKPHHGADTSEGTVVVAAGDWHSEEVVEPASVSGLNRHNSDIAQDRAIQFFRNSLRLTQIFQQDIKIDTMLMAWLGDFFTGFIHDEFKDINDQLPIDAVLFAQSLLASGVEYLLKNSKLKIKIVCKIGNHSRTTKVVHWASEAGHSLEYFMYRNLAQYFKDEDRVEFVIDRAYHTFVTVYDKVLRIHHGHALQYQGGVGGLFIPAYKKIAQWDKARRADLDLFGHFHQSKDGGKFICNGSQIGYNAFAVKIGADFEPPSQTLFLLDKKRGRTFCCPIKYEVET
jgi:hypothetical protein